MNIRRLVLSVVGSTVVLSGLAVASPIGPLGPGRTSPSPSVSPVAPAAAPESSDDGTSKTTGTATVKSERVTRSTDGCAEGFTGNHGQFVSQADDKRTAAHSPCGKPVQSLKESDGDDADDSEKQKKPKKPKPAKQPKP